MSLSDGVGWRIAASGLLRSYVSDLRGWAGGLATKYAVAAALAFGGVLAVFAACGVGITALFHLIERLYGAGVAYGAVGGGLGAMGGILILLAWSMLRVQASPLPGPHRQVQTARRMVMNSATARAFANLDVADRMRADPGTRALAGAAAVILTGWFVASRFEARSHRRRAGR